MLHLQEGFSLKIEDIDMSTVTSDKLLHNSGAKEARTAYYKH